MSIIPVSHQARFSCVKFAANGAMMQKIQQGIGIVSKGSYLMSSGKLKKLLHSQSMFNLVDLLQIKLAYIHGVIVISVPSAELHTTSVTRGGVSLWLRIHESEQT